MDSFLPGSASLIDMVDKQITIILRDGRYFIGNLKTYDQFANLVLQDTIERIYTNQKEFGVKEWGIFIIRGENVALLGEIDVDKDTQVHTLLESIPDKQAITRKKESEDMELQHKLELQNSTLRRLGFSPEHFKY